MDWILVVSEYKWFYLVSKRLKMEILYNADHAECKRIIKLLVVPTARYSRNFQQLAGGFCYAQHLRSCFINNDVAGISRRIKVSSLGHTNLVCFHKIFVRAKQVRNPWLLRIALVFQLHHAI